MLRSIVFGTPASESAAARADACESGLKQFQGRNPVLVVFGDKANAEFMQQKTLLSGAQDGLLSRRVIVLFAKAHTVTPFFGEAEPLDYDMLRTRLSGPDAGRFMAVLVGEDGMVKLREREAVTPRELFNVLDTQLQTASASRI